MATAASNRASVRLSVKEMKSSPEHVQKLPLLTQLNQLPYTKQAISFLNAFWATGPTFKESKDKRELVWTFHNIFLEVDPKKENGNELDEVQTLRVFELLKQPITALEKRKLMADVDVDGSHKASLVEVLLRHFGIDWLILVDAPQGNESDKKLLEDAENQIKMASDAIAESQEKVAKAKADEETAQKAAKEAGRENELI